MVVTATAERVYISQGDLALLYEAIPRNRKYDTLKMLQGVSFTYNESGDATDTSASRYSVAVPRGTKVVYLLNKAGDTMITFYTVAVRLAGCDEVRYRDLSICLEKPWLFKLVGGACPRQRSVTITASSSKL